jgi:hypothetical protein
LKEPFVDSRDGGLRCLDFTSLFIARHYLWEKRLMKRMLVMLLVGCAVWGASQKVQAQVTVSVDPSAAWLGYMNVSELPSNGGAFLWGSGWGTTDLVASFSGPVLTLSPNTIGDPNEYWYIGGGGPGAQGNKIMAASFYQEATNSYSGINLTFTGKVLSNTFTSAHSTVAFIKDFAPDYSSNVPVTVPLNVDGTFSISLNTIPAPGRHVQWGFETTGVNVWVTDVAPYGNIQIIGVPEPASLAMGALGIIGMLVVRGRRC